MVFMRNGGGAVVANRAINNDRFLQMLKKRKIINTFRSNHVVYVNSAVFVFGFFLKMFLCFLFRSIYLANITSFQSEVISLSSFKQVIHRS